MQTSFLRAGNTAVHKKKEIRCIELQNEELLAQYWSVNSITVIKQRRTRWQRKVAMVVTLRKLAMVVRLRKVAMVVTLGKVAMVVTLRKVALVVTMRKVEMVVALRNAQTGKPKVSPQ